MKILKIQSVLYCRTKQYEITSMHPCSLRALEQYQEHTRGLGGLGDLNVTKQINYLS
jgi:hypothetical protein